MNSLQKFVNRAWNGYVAFWEGSVVGALLAIWGAIVSVASLWTWTPTGGDLFRLLGIGMFAMALSFPLFLLGLRCFAAQKQPKDSREYLAWLLVRRLMSFRGWFQGLNWIIALVSTATVFLAVSAIHPFLIPFGMTVFVWWYQLSGLSQRVIDWESMV